MRQCHQFCHGFTQRSERELPTVTHPSLSLPRLRRQGSSPPGAYQWRHTVRASEANTASAGADPDGGASESAKEDAGPLSSTADCHKRRRLRQSGKAPGAAQRRRCSTRCTTCLTGDNVEAEIKGFRRNIHQAPPTVVFLPPISDFCILRNVPPSPISCHRTSIILHVGCATKLHRAQCARHGGDD